MNKIELLKLTKELTGSSDISELIKYSKQIENYINGDKNKILPKLKFIINHPRTGIQEVDFNEQQEYLNQQYKENNMVAFFTTKRQSGVSSFIAYKSLCEAIYNKNKTILIVSKNHLMSKDILCYIKTIINYSGNIGSLPGIIKYNSNCIKFDNNSTIITRACTKDCVRGLSPDIIFIDNFSYISYSVLNDFLKSIVNPETTKIIGFSTGCDKDEIVKIETY